MSHQTKRALEDAIRAHVADECAKTIVGWELVTCAIDGETYGDGGASYWREMPDGQQVHASEGLLRAGLRMVADVWARGED